MLIRELEKMTWLAYYEWRHLLANPQIEGTRDSVTWAGYTKHFVPVHVRPLHVLKLAEDRQYTFQMSTDGAVFQIYYQVSDDGKSVKTAKLAYYGVHSVDTDIDPEEEALYSEVYGIDVVESDAHTAASLRLDYSPAEARGLAHSACHLHLGGFANSRLIVRGIPNPKQFVEFIMHLRYPNEFADHRLDKDTCRYRDANALSRINEPAMKCEDEDFWGEMTHLCVASESFR